MNQQSRKKSAIITTIFTLSVIPFILAWFFAANPQKVKIGGNYGELITPPLTIDYNWFIGIDSVTTANLQELQGHWILITPIVARHCAEVCEDALYKSRQISLMMGKDIIRIRRAALVFDDNAGQFGKTWEEDVLLLKIFAGKNLKRQLQTALFTPILDGELLIMDPFGNLMMKYAPGYDPYQVKHDLGKLLRISQIG